MIAKRIMREKLAKAKENKTKRKSLDSLIMIFQLIKLTNAEENHNQSRTCWCGALKNLTQKEKSNLISNSLFPLILATCMLMT